MKTKQLLEFNKAFGIQVNRKPTVKANFQLNARLIKEELNEYIAANVNGDIVEIADALGDMAYLVLGAAVQHGIELEPIFNEIHSSNMSKLDDDGKPIYREDGKVMKSENYKKPNIKDALMISNMNKYFEEAGIKEYIQAVVESVGEVYELTLEEIQSRCRKSKIAESRHMISYLVHDRFKSYSVYGLDLRNILNRDRTSFIHSVKTIETWLTYDSETINKVAVIQDLVIQKLSKDE